MPSKENFTTQFMDRFAEDAVKIAECKIAELEEYYRQNPPPIPILPRIATGGRFTGLFVWDACLNTFWGKYYPERLPVFSSLDNFYRLQAKDGYICREYQADGKPFWSRKHPVCNNPAIFAWAELDLYQYGISDKARLQKVYPHLKKHHEFCWNTYRRMEDGLFYGDALGCGLDNTPRLPKEPGYNLRAGIQMRYQHVLADNKRIWFHYLKGLPLHCWNRQMGWIDFSSIMAFNALNLAKIAEIIGENADARQFRGQHAELKKIINKLCWNDDLGFYCDSYNGKTIPRYFAPAFWTLIAEIVPPERAEVMKEKLLDPGIFNTLVPLPTLAPCEPEYDPENGYQLGAVWAPMVYVALHGLRKLGMEDTAHYFAKKYYHANAELYRKYHTVFENISAEQYDHPKNRCDSDYCGYGNLAPIAIRREFLQETPDNTREWVE